MEAYPDSPHVQVFCLQGVAKLELEETEFGLARDDAVRSAQRALYLLAHEKWRQVEGVVGAALGAMAALADNYANRGALMKEEGWLGVTVRALHNLKNDEQEVKVRERRKRRRGAKEKRGARRGEGKTRGKERRRRTRARSGEGERGARAATSLCRSGDLTLQERRPLSPLSSPSPQPPLPFPLPISLRCARPTAASPR